MQVITYDMTEQKQAQQFEAERIRLRAELEREQSLSALRTRLLSLISHEFRTPLTIMLSATELLTKYGDRLPADVRMAKIAGIAEQVQHLAHLLDEINKLTIANRGFLDYRPEQTDIALLCQRVFNTMSQLLTPHHTLALDLPQGDLSAVLDKTLMQHALTNLIGNAIKYSPQGGAICLRVRQADDVWHFSVTDEGMGIPPEDQTDLFKPFSRASNVGQIRGTGLGLSIVQEVAQQHAGYVTVESRVDVGSTFTMAIPLQTGASDGLHSDH